MVDKGIQRQPVPVTDPPSERGININNLLTSLILFVLVAGIAWVGSSIEEIKKSVSEMNKQQALTQQSYEALSKQFEQHARDPFAHIQLRKRPHDTDGN